MKTATTAKLAPAILRALRAADAAVAKASQSTQVAFQAFHAAVLKAYPQGVKAAELFRAIHGPDAVTKENGAPTAAYTRAARAVRLAFPAAVKARKPAAAGSKGKGKGKADKATRAPAPSVASVVAFLIDPANMAEARKFLSAHAEASRKLAALLAK